VSGERGDNLSPLERRLEDVVDALQGIGVEMEALVTVARAVATAKLGDDPLAGSSYALRDSGGADEDEGEGE
jgi:hypothetical protein